MLFSVIVTSELFDVDRRSGSLPWLRAAPVGETTVLVAEGVAIAIFTFVAASAFRAIDGAAFNRWTSESSAVWRTAFLSVAEFEPWAVRIGLIIVAFAALISVALQHALASTLAGILVPFAVIVGLSHAGPSLSGNAAFNATLSAFAQCALDIRYPLGILIALVPLVLAFRLRGRASRSAPRRSSRAILVASLVLVTPTVGYGAFDAILGLSHYEEGDARIQEFAVSRAGDKVAFAVEDGQFKRKGIFILYTLTHEISPCDDWLTGWRVFAPHYHDAHVMGWTHEDQLLVRIVAAQAGRGSIAIFTATGELDEVLRDHELVEKLYFPGHDVDVAARTIRVDDGSETITLDVRHFHFLPRTSTPCFYSSERVPYAFDPKNRRLRGLAIGSGRHATSISPDGKWLAHKTDLYSLPDLEKRSFERNFNGWTKREHPMLLQPERGDRSWRAGGPSGAVEILPYEEYGRIEDLDGDRWIEKAKNGLRILDSDGEILFEL